MDVYAVASETITIGQPAGLKILDIGPLISGAISLIIIIAAVAFFFMLIFGGLQWILSGGDKSATEGARNRITAALIGLVIVFAAWAILRLIEQFLGITILGQSVTIPKGY